MLVYQRVNSPELCQTSRSLAIPRPSHSLRAERPTELPTVQGRSAKTRPVATAKSARGGNRAMGARRSGDPMIIHKMYDYQWLWLIIIGSPKNDGDFVDNDVPIGKLYDTKGQCKLSNDYPIDYVWHSPMKCPPVVKCQYDPTKDIKYININYSWLMSVDD